MLEFANFISVLPLYYIICIIIILVYGFIIQNKLWKSLLIYFIGLLFALFLPALIKSITSILKIKNKSFYRPNGAKGCDFQSIKGIARPFTPGFPSGHMTITSFVIIFNILMIFDNKNSKISKVQKYILIFINVFIIIFMSWARHYKKCHNVFQIISGILLGAVISKITFDMLKY